MIFNEDKVWTHFCSSDPGQHISIFKLKLLKSSMHFQGKKEFAVETFIPIICIN